MITILKKLKISISYPPLSSKKGTPLLSQNRQFQWFSSPTYIYPVILASAATLLQKNDYEVFWDDAIAEEFSYDEWLKRILEEKPDIIAIETKTPVIKRHWEIVSMLKAQSSKLKAAKIVLMGDHVTAMPEESLKNSPADYVICGGDYDFSLLKLADHLSRGSALSGGFYFKDDDGSIKSSGPVNLAENNLDSLPIIDRELTKWHLYAYKNGNFKYTPGTYVMNARDCWWGKCSFCSWTTLFPSQNYRRMSVTKALDEIGHLISFGVKEIMEDSGTLPIGSWLEEFCRGMIDREYNKKVSLSCNMRLDAIKDKETWQLIKKAGFRMILFGFESANQTTLDRINKNLKVEEVEPALEACSGAGLEPHLTVMVGYPWETRKEVQNTLDFIKRLVEKNLLASLQATIVIPYPGTPLFNYCRENNLLLTDDYGRFDQGEAVIKSEISDAEIKKITRSFYRSFINPRYLSKKLSGIKNWNDIVFLARAGGKFFGHLNDFSGKKRN